ncbi:MAG TPA: glycosyl hydrolase [Ktedonobacteraceae bacterium]|nr:glycosyl hydrolase [Ktedonobacteraceae bacterium]
MTRLYIALEQALAIVDQQNGAWKAEMQLTGHHTQCVAVDPLRPQYVYCGTFGEGLWRSRDAGASWEPIGEGVIQKQVMSVAVSKTEQRGAASVVYAGTEPSAFYRSEDGGTSWQEMERLRQLPSAPTWSFPPRPYTSHIRWITPDPLVEGRLFVAVEAGALLRSLDGGEHWEDRKPGGPFDTHTLVMHQLAPDRLYSAAGDGFMHAGNGFVQSDDGGETWYRPDDGLQHHYLWGAAADPADPATIVVSAAPGPQQAHDPAHALSALYRRSASEPWQLLQDGLPAQQGTLASVIAANEAEAHVFYAANNQGIFRSTDAGYTWEQLPITWPATLQASRPQAIVAVAEA